MLASGLGRWIRRDSLGYSDGSGLQVYSRDNPSASVDPSGLVSAKFTNTNWLSKGCGAGFCKVDVNLLNTSNNLIQGIVVARIGVQTTSTCCPHDPPISGPASINWDFWEIWKKVHVTPDGLRVVPWTLQPNVWKQNGDHEFTSGTSKETKTRVYDGVVKELQWVPSQNIVPLFKLGFRAPQPAPWGQDCNFINESKRLITSSTSLFLFT